MECQRVCVPAFGKKQTTFDETLNVSNEAYQIFVYDLTLETWTRGRKNEHGNMKIWNMKNTIFSGIAFFPFAQDECVSTFVELITVLFLLIFDLLYSYPFLSLSLFFPFLSVYMRIGETAIRYYVLPFMRLILFRYCEILLKGPKRQSMNWLLF